jgi:hypothetical protein
MTKFQELSAELFGDPANAILDIKFDLGPEARNSNREEMSAMILAAIRDIRAGGGRDIDLSI